MHFFPHTHWNSALLCSVFMLIGFSLALGVSTRFRVDRRAPFSSFETPGTLAGCVSFSLVCASVARDCFLVACAPLFALMPWRNARFSFSLAGLVSTDTVKCFTGYAESTREMFHRSVQDQPWLLKRRRTWRVVAHFLGCSPPCGGWHA